jgi:hypothetical protein
MKFLELQSVVINSQVMQEVVMVLVALVEAEVAVAMGEFIFLFLYKSLEAVGEY